MAVVDRDVIGSDIVLDDDVGLADGGTVERDVESCRTVDERLGLLDGGAHLALGCLRGGVVVRGN